MQTCKPCICPPGGYKGDSYFTIEPKFSSQGRQGRGGLPNVKEKSQAQTRPPGELSRCICQTDAHAKTIGDLLSADAALRQLSSRCLLTRGFTSAATAS